MLKTGLPIFIIAALLSSLEIACQQPGRTPALKSMVPTKAEKAPIRNPKSNWLITIGECPKDWLKARTTVQQAESDNMVSDPALGPEPISFGSIHKQWIAFKSLLVVGDELWTYSERGSSGLCIVRGHKVIAYFTLTIA